MAPVHLLACDALPKRPEHRDPFDRRLVAQASSERITLLTTDRALPSYSPMVHGVG